jgi:hypothetical protein
MWILLMIKIIIIIIIIMKNTFKKKSKCQKMSKNYMGMDKIILDNYIIKILMKYSKFQ